MNIFKRTWMSVTKRKGKTLILFLVVFLIGNIMAGAVAIYNSTNQLEESMKNQLGAKASIDINFNMEGGITPDTMVNLTSDDADKVGELPQVKNTSYNINLQLGSDTLKNYEKDKSKDEEISSGNGMMVSSFAGAEGLTIRGFKGNPPSELTDKTIEIIEGEYPKEDSDKKEILISNEYAKLNNLKVGDTLKHSVYKIDYKSQGNEVSYEYKTEYEFIVSGLFKVNSQPTNKQDPFAGLMEEMQYNSAYISFKNANEIDKQAAIDIMSKDDQFCKTETACRSMILPIYELNSVDDIDSFVEETKKIIDTDKFVIKTTKDEYDKVAGSIVNMKDMSKSVLIFGVGAAILILTLVLFLFMRDRKHEFGIYQALGESRLKSTIQVLLEVLTITIVGVSLAFVSGNILAKGISNTMINNQISSNKENEMNGMISIGGFENNLSNFTEEEVIENYKVEVTTESVIIFYSIMIGSAMIATAASSIYILRLKPREILL